MTISTPMILSLWINSTKEASSLSLTGALHEKLGVNELDLVNSTLVVPVSPGLKLYNLAFDLSQDLPLQVFSFFSVGLKITPIRNANLTLFWGSSTAPSGVVLRLSGYESLSATNPMEILGGIPSKPLTSFDLNSTYPNNIVFFQASVFSAFGKSDIQDLTFTLLPGHIFPMPLLEPIR